MLTHKPTVLHGCFLHYRDVGRNNERPTGMDLKVAAQIRSLSHAGFVCDFIHCPQPETTIGKAISCLPLMGDGVKWPSPALIAGYDFVYIRRPRFASRELITFLQAVKTLNPMIKVLYEIPTYPYDSEMKPLHMRLAGMKDLKWRGYLRRYVDCIPYIGYENHDEVFGCRCLRIRNGIDLDRAKMRNPAAQDGTVRILSVAQFMPWHGVDRLIAGMGTYYARGGERSVVLHLVGDGEAVPALKKQAGVLGLQDRVVFHGRMAPKDFDHLYDECDIAAASLGMHRFGAKVASTLKTREYLAKGIPFVYAGDIDVFVDNPVDFCLRVSSDDAPVSVQEIISFCDTCYASESPWELTRRIRSYAERYVSMDAAMEPVVCYLEEGCSYD